jgi:hypothetical protein
MTTETWTITFSESVENHAGMQIIGKKHDQGTSVGELETLEKIFIKNGYVTELVDLQALLPADAESESDESGSESESESESSDAEHEPVIKPPKDAKILVIRGGIRALTDDYEALKAEVEGSKNKVDKKAWMRGRVVNKIARYNLCYSDRAQKPDYANKKGTIIAFRTVPELQKVRKSLGKLFSIVDDKKKYNNLFAELNYYYDDTCGIRAHGDSERFVVIGLRFGHTMSLCYHWFHHSKPIGTKKTLMLNDGDFYIMSEKATGNDWKRRTIPTLRHSAGNKTYTDIKV